MRPMACRLREVLRTFKLRPQIDGEGDSCGTIAVATVKFNERV